MTEVTVLCCVALRYVVAALTLAHTLAVPLVRSLAWLRHCQLQIRVSLSVSLSHATVATLSESSKQLATLS